MVISKIKLLKDKTICIVSEFPPPAGGIAQQASVLSSLLQKEGFSVVELATNFKIENPFPSIKKIPYLKTIVLFLTFLSGLFQSLFRTDILHVFASSYLNYFLFTYPAVIVGRLFNKRIVLHYHGGAADSFFNKWGWFAKFPVILSNKFIVPSSFLLEIFEKYGIRAEILPNVANLDVFSYSARLPLQPVFLSIRNLEPIYNIECILRAFDVIRAQYPESVLHIVGGGSEEEKLLQLSIQLGVSDNVVFHGRVLNEKVFKFYQKCDILLNASNIDNMPVSLIEAFASGCVIVSTRAGGIPFLIDHQKNGLLVEKNNPEALAREAVWLMKNPEKALKIAENANEKVKEFSWKSIGPRLIKIYTSL